MSSKSSILPEYGVTARIYDDVCTASNVVQGFSLTGSAALLASGPVATGAMTDLFWG